MVTLELDARDIATLRFDTADGKPNLLNAATMAEFERHVESLFTQPKLRGVIVTGGARSGFLAGVDVNEIGKLATSADPAKAANDVRAICETAQRIFARLRTLTQPVIAAINGVCLGGGLELALACKYRIAADDRQLRIGLPEVTLGIIPGFGGTQRLVRLVGYRRAIDVACSGRHFSPREALKLGVLDEVVPPELLLDVAASAIERWQTPAMHEHLTQRLRPQGWRARLAESWLGRKVVGVFAQRKILAEGKGNYPAPSRALAVITAGMAMSLEDGLKLEREAVAELLTAPPPTSPAAHLLNLFALRESHRKRSNLPLGLGASHFEPQLPAVNAIGVVGAGFMGGGIAQLLANDGIRIRMRDVQPASLAVALKTAHDLTRSQVKRGRLSKAEGMALLDRIGPTLELTGFSHCDMVVEAVVERLDVKRQVMAELDRLVPAECVLCTNTSSLSVGEIAAGLTRPNRVIGLHFFSPVHKMPLVEIIPGPKTDGETIERVFALAVRLGKVPVFCRDTPGFLANRILGAYLNEAAWALLEGWSPGKLDAALRQFGMPVGPCELLDEVGIRVAAEVANALHTAWPARFDNTTLNTKLLEKGLVGKRAPKGGFYSYWAWRGKPTRHHSREFAVLISELRQQLNIKPKAAESPIDVADRLVAAMANEAWAALRDGVVSKPDDVDAASVFGLGFPPFRGGLMRYVSAVGEAKMIERLKRLADEHGSRLAPQK